MPIIEEITETNEQGQSTKQAHLRARKLFPVPPTPSATAITWDNTDAKHASYCLANNARGFATKKFAIQIRNKWQCVLAAVETASPSRLDSRLACEMLMSALSDALKLSHKPLLAGSQQALPDTLTSANSQLLMLQGLNATETTIFRGIDTALICTPTDLMPKQLVKIAQEFILTLSELVNNPTFKLTPGDVVIFLTISMLALSGILFCLRNPINRCLKRCGIDIMSDKATPQERAPLMPKDPATSATDASANHGSTDNAINGRRPTSFEISVAP